MPEISKERLKGKRLLITAGPCREYLDPVRYISNRSSGRMGYALAESAQLAGAEVTLVSGPTVLSPPKGVRLVSVETTDQMLRAVQQSFTACDCLIMAAAPSDFAPSEIAPQKIKKSEAGRDIHLEPTVDILKKMSGERREGQLLIGFALETTNPLENAKAKLKKKGLDMIVLNQSNESNQAFDSEVNRVTIIRPNQDPESWPSLSKLEISHRLLDSIALMF